jgi:hypothetical protein
VRAEYEESERRAGVKSWNNSIGWILKNGIKPFYELMERSTVGLKAWVQNTVGSGEKERKFNKFWARDSFFMWYIYLSPKC